MCGCLKKLGLQALLLTYMALLPIALITYTPTLVSLLGIGQYLGVVGLALLSWGFSYTKLPWDLIPDWIPIIGTLDDALFGNVTMLIGVCMSLLGVFLMSLNDDGSGNSPEL